jgi:hypothetical protein
VRDALAWVTASVSSMLSTACHHPGGTNIVSPGPVTPSSIPPPAPPASPTPATAAAAAAPPSVLPQPQPHAPLPPLGDMGSVGAATAPVAGAAGEEEGEEEEEAAGWSWRRMSGSSLRNQSMAWMWEGARERKEVRKEGIWRECRKGKGFSKKNMV